METTERQQVETLAADLRASIRALAAHEGTGEASRLAVTAYLTLHLLLDERDTAWNSAIEAATSEVERLDVGRTGADVAAVLRGMRI
ncbi:hypothetical protein [Wenxinia marina]|uniref:Uncharacterized protein n=1 Tax=Wenxinia marina DSM 24838 TaxID=1123501 RepID=A0A0D0PIW9_9RHOB|nr:hypothetical protein [Wenxinia marina]KIQ71331.1 hypothetical protein Wenmar_00100 [Wenxinia marina DSM 24838]GGL73955.1 hypothetical protein GCM10011392_30590 [Wenxinia marina]